jgi:Arc/MetJ family transcription regulator
MRRAGLVDGELLEEAQRVLGTKSIRETIETGLREVVRRRRLQELRRSLGTMDLDLTPEKLARLRDEDCAVPGGHLGLAGGAAASDRQ